MPTMHRTAAGILAAGVVAAAMAGLPACSAGGDATQQASAGAEAPSDAAARFATLGDIISEEGKEGLMSTYDDDTYSCAFRYGGEWLRATATLPDGAYGQLVDGGDAGAILADVPVTGIDSLGAGPSDEELASLAGQTGAELELLGFVFLPGTLVVNGDVTDCCATRSPFDYLVTFDGAVADEGTPDAAGAVSGLVVRSVAVQGVSWDALT